MELSRETKVVVVASTGVLVLTFIWEQYFAGADSGGLFKASLFGAPDTPTSTCTTPASWWRPIDTAARLMVGPALSSDYYIDLADKVNNFGASVVVDDEPVSEEDITRIRTLVFTDIRTTDAVATRVSADGTACASAEPFANVSVEDGDLINKEYPRLAELPPDKQLWLRAHELGHGIDAVVGAVEDFNKLSEAERVEILTELQRLREALAAKGYVVSYTNGKELFANLYAALMLEPKLAEDLAPNASQFLGGLVNNDPELGKVLKFA